MAEDELLADTNAPVCAIPVNEAFSGLTESEKLYTHHMCRAAFHGTRIVLQQTSAESESIFDLICALYKAVGGDWQALADRCGVGDHDLKYFLEYAAMFLGNLGNYRSTGDTKFTPRLPCAAFERLCEISTETASLFESVAKAVYSETPCRYGYSADRSCASGYYPGPNHISKEEVTAVQTVLQDNHVLPENTRIRKVLAPGNQAEFHVLLASSDSQSTWKPSITKGRSDLVLAIQNCDFAGPLERVVVELEHALRYSVGEKQNEMIHALIKCFRSGDHNAFKDAQSSWVQDRSPTVDTVIGFIETYQDPHGVRGAWEGIVAVVNKIQTRKFALLVEEASDFILTLPWNGAGVGLENGRTSFLESPSFIKPDFTSLDTVGFVKSESPAGLNLPNFEDICQNTGSKNLEFGNVNLANPPDETIPFIRPDEIEFVRKHREAAFEVLVACHELLGHGSGRLLAEIEPDEFNIDIHNPPLDPITGVPIRSYYKYGETWQSVFGADANAIEECRADGVSLLLITNARVLEIFGYSNHSAMRADDVMYAGYLTFIYGAIKGLSRWDPATRRWGQSHRRGKFALLQCLLACGPELLEIQESEDDLHILLDRTKLKNLAVPALNKFLLRLQIYRSTANSHEGVPFFDAYSQVDETFARYREHVLARDPPRIQYVQPSTFLKDEKVCLAEYPATKQGIIQSWVERGV